jgi:hypothetical protein
MEKFIYEVAQAKTAGISVSDSDKQLASLAAQFLTIGSHSISSAFQQDGARVDRMVNDGLPNLL